MKGEVYNLQYCPAFALPCFAHKFVNGKYMEQEKTIMIVCSSFASKTMWTVINSF